MRGFEYIGRGSEKFWEIGQDGTTVTVRFGRLGTNGQTQTKELGSAAEAAAHVEKLIAEKVRKGYVEAAGGAAPARSAQAPPPDEDTFVLPGAWARKAEPFRGLRPVPRLTIDVEATRAEGEGLRQQLAGFARAFVDHPSSDPELVHHARLHARGQHDPLGVAVLMAALFGRQEAWRDGDRQCHVAVDDLVLAHGIPFAAAAGAHLADIAIGHELDRSRRISHWWIQRRKPGEFEPRTAMPALARLRAHLAAAPDGSYAEAVARLAELRTGPPLVRMATSYLAPTEQAWVHEDAAGLAAARPSDLMSAMLLASATDPADVDAILAAAETWTLIHRPQWLWSIGANLGAEATRALVTVLDEVSEPTTHKRVLGMIAALPTDEAFTALLDRVDRKYVQPVVLEAMRRYPVRAARLLATAANGTSGTARTCKELLRGHVISHPELGEHPEALGADGSGALEAAAREASAVPVAHPADLPAVLVNPPWEKRERAAAPTVLTGLTRPSVLALRWKPGEREEWAQRAVTEYRRLPSDWAAEVARVVNPGNRFDYRALGVFAAAPLDLVRPHLAGFTPDTVWDGLPAVQRILARFGEEAAAFTLRVVCSRPASLAPALLPVEGGAVADRMAEWFARSTSIRPVVRAWLERHPEAAARDLVPAALGKPGRERSAAEAVLRELDRSGHRAEVSAAAESYGSEAVAATDALLDADPLRHLPARIPAHPGWLDPAHLPPVLLPDRSAALPTEAVGHICTMLAISKPDDPYAGIPVVQAAVDPASLAEMVWGVFERWQAAGSPNKDGWVLQALALCGDDETVRRLAPLIRAWPGQGGHSRAVSGLRVLAQIGTEVALMHLNGIAEKVKFKGLKVKAQETIAEVADGLGLSPEQLADRLVPDFGLDRNGSMVLDYGPRRFTVGFDEQLKPVVADEDGSRRKALPKPAAKDDPVLAPAAYAAFSALKKDVRTIAADQIRRFEQAMVRGRRWSAAEQRALFVEHPLLWHLARRLVWATFDEAGAVTGSFRVAEDRTLADSDDAEVTLADDTRVGIAHPLHLRDRLGAWTELFADYEILQPFPQLGRETWALTAEEERATVLHRLDGVVVPTGRVLGLAHRGWERGVVEDAGISGAMYKPVAGTRVLVLELDPGIIAGMATEWNEQKVTGVWVSDGIPDWSPVRGHRPFSELDDVTASELLRDLEHLRG